MTGRRPKRIRRSPDDLRAEALAAARRLIVEGSGEALTMRAVADAIGVTYPNLSHHFGSAAGLHAAVAADLVRELLAALRAIGSEMERPLQNPARVVDVFFDMFERDGLGRLVNWLARAGGQDAAEQVRVLVEAHLSGVEARFADEATRLHSLIPRVALVLCLTAYAETSAGGLFGEALGFSAIERRAVITEVLTAMKRVDG